jgi:hypothetical protein
VVVFDKLPGLVAVLPLRRARRRIPHPVVACEYILMDGIAINGTDSARIFALYLIRADIWGPSRVVSVVSILRTHSITVR